MITKYRRKLMTYIQSNHYLTNGIQALSMNEIDFVSGGTSPTPPQSETPQEKAAREERERKAKERELLCEIAGGIGGVLVGTIVSVATAPVVSPAASTAIGASMGVAVAATATAACVGPVTKTPNP
jgi:hypothetical protein